MSYIHLENISFNYYYFDSLGFNLWSRNSRRHSKAALNNINLHIEQGDRVALLGRNGAGKSTILRVIAGVFPPNTGHVNVEGEIYSFFGRSVGINQFLSGYENLKVRGLLLGLNKQEIESTIDKISDFTELGDAMSHPVSTYSQGMKARLTFGMMMFVNADILLIDEGLGAGDRFFINKARAFIDELLEQSKILIFASHSDHLLKRFCNKALLLKEGRMIEYGDYKSVVKVYNTGDY